MRSRLGLAWEACDRLPWWQHRAYLDGLEWDLARDSRASGEEQEETVSLEEFGIPVREV